MYNVNYPFGAADHLQPPFAATLNVEVRNAKTILEPAILTGAMTLNITPSAELPKGAELICKIKATATETVTFGTGIDAPALVGVAGKTKVQAFVFDGTNFIAIGAFVQID